ncbi:hypothetical protein [Paenibacillus marinisediminis]
MTPKKKQENSKKEIEKMLASIGIVPTSVPREQRGSFSFVGGTRRELIIRTK